MNLSVLILVYLSSLTIARVLRPLNRGPFYNSIYYLFLIGFVFYAGTSIARNNIPQFYTFLYYAFLLAFCVSYSIFHKLLMPFQRVSLNSMERFLSPKLTGSASTIIIVSYLLLTTIPLLVPTFRLGLFISPPPPNLIEVFSARLDGVQRTELVRTALLLKTLATPIFFLAIYSARQNLLKVYGILLLAFYLEYLDTGYKSRGELLVCFFPLAYYLWMYAPRSRKVMIIMGVFSAPFVLQFFDFYESLRRGEMATSADSSLTESIEKLLLAETSFVETAGLSVMYSNARADLWSYFTWIATLPLPKVFTGDFSGMRLNTELSMLALNLTPDQKGYFIFLPGVIAESLYLFGREFFWVHAVFMGFIVALLTRIFQGSEKFVFLAGYIGFILMYNFNRGGIASTLPILVNQLFLIYAIMFLFVLRKKHGDR